MFRFMNDQPSGLQAVLATLSVAARQQGLTDSAWARAAGLPKESLSRLRRRSDCDWSTLEKLSGVVGQRLDAVTASGPAITHDGLFPESLSRDDEERLYRLVHDRDWSPARWRATGPMFFMAGLAVLLSGERDFPRRELLQLAEALHPGISEPVVYTKWLQRTPIEPSRFFAHLNATK